MAQGDDIRELMRGQEEILRMLATCQTRCEIMDAKTVQNHTALYGNGKGLLTRCALLENAEKKRSAHIKALWTFLSAVIIALIGLLGKAIGK